MECWDNYCYYPWPVQVTVQSGGGSTWTWLGPLLLFAASLAASGVAWYGIRKNHETNRASNETNRLAIAAADDREMVKWRRERLLKLASEAAVAATEFTLAMRAARDRKSGATVSQAEMDKLKDAIRLLSDSADHLLLVGATGLSNLSTAMFDAARPVVQKYQTLIQAKAQISKQLGDDYEDLSEVGANSPEELEQHEREVHEELVAEPLAAFDDAVGAFRTARRKFVSEAQRQLNAPTTQIAEQLSASSQPLARPKG